MKNAVIVAIGRSACARAKKGSLSMVHPVEYAAQVLAGVINKVPMLDAAEIEDVITGCAFPSKRTGWNVSRLIANRAGLPDSVPAQTINRFCSSGLQSIATAANAIAAGQMDVVVAGGVEDLSESFVSIFPEEFRDSWLAENYIGAYMQMGETAERVADKYGVTREQMDAFAAESHQKAASAQNAQKLAPSIIPVIGNSGQAFAADEGIRPDSSTEALGKLKPSFRENGKVTAGNASQVTDGAAFAVLMSGKKVNALGIKPLARFCSFSVAGCDSTLMGMGPVYAVPKALSLAGLNLADMDVIELNEAFAAQALPCIEQLGLPVDKVNPYGGAIALGHPMGATGTILTCKALDYLNENNGRYALITMCIGGGMGAAGVIERL